MQVGDILGKRYEILELMAHGGMGKVYKARHIHLGRMFAVKALRPELADHPEAVALFWREAEAAAALGSVHAVDVTDLGETPEGEPYLVMEHLEGRDLEQVLNEDGPLDTEEVVEIGLQVCEGLVAAHSQGIVHRDLKPANLFLTRREDGTACVKILDFGIAQFRDHGSPSVGRSDEVAVPPGTSSYMAPEQATCAPEADHRVDIYSLGVVLYELLTGQPPFQGKTLPQLFYNIVTSSSLSASWFRPDIDPALERVVRRAMALEPQDRYPTAAHLAFALAPFAPTSPTALRFARPPECLTPPNRTHKQWAFPPAPARAGASPGPTEGRQAEPATMGYRRAPSQPQRSSRLSVALGGSVGLVTGLIAAILLALFLSSRASAGDGTPTGWRWALAAARAHAQAILASEGEAPDHAEWRQGELVCADDDISADGDALCVKPLPEEAGRAPAPTAGSRPDGAERGETPDGGPRQTFARPQAAGSAPPREAAPLVPAQVRPPRRPIIAESPY